MNRGTVFVSLKGIRFKDSGFGVLGPYLLLKIQGASIKTVRPCPAPLTDSLDPEPQTLKPHMGVSENRGPQYSTLSPK